MVELSRPILAARWNHRSLLSQQVSQKPTHVWISFFVAKRKSGSQKVKHMFVDRAAIEISACSNLEVAHNVSRSVPR